MKKVFALWILTLVLLGVLSPAVSAPGGALLAFKERARNQYKESLNKYNESVREYKEARQEFFEVRNRFLASRRMGKGGNETTVIEAAKKYLLVSTDNLLALIEHVENEVGSINSSELEQTQEQWLLELQEAKRNITVIKEEINQIKDRQSLNSVAKKTNLVWKYVRRIAHKVYYLARVEKGVLTHKKLENLYQKIQALTAELKAKGVDTTEIENSLKEVKTSLENCRQSFQQAKLSFSEQNFENGKMQLKESREFLNRAMKEVRSSFGKYKELKGE